MLALFCLRLACGMVACLLLLSPAQVNPRFFRTHFLTALGLTVLAAVRLRDTAGPWLWLALAAVTALCFLGSVVWLLEGAPGGRALVYLTAPALAVALVLAGQQRGGAAPGWLLADDLTSAALLGAATTAMLMGHSYLIAPAMSLTP